MTQPKQANCGTAAWRHWRIIGVATVGTIVEWYDFAIYGAATALVFNQLFFPSTDAITGVLASYATFAVGFLMRPLGGIIFAHLGDRYGRRPVLLSTILLMGGATTAIGLLPTYASIGPAAPISLVLMRILQGIGAGAEFSGAILYSGEQGNDRRGFLTSWPVAAVNIALALSAIVFALSSAITEDQFLIWGWRIPFLLALPCLVAAYVIRRRVSETPEFLAATQVSRPSRIPVLDLIIGHPRRVLVAMGISIGPNIGYVYNVYSLGFLTGHLGVPRQTALASLVITALCTAAISVFFGYLSDRIGTRVLMLTGALFSAAYAFPYFWLLETRNPLLIVLGMIVGNSIGVYAMFAVLPAFYIGLFETRLRFSGIVLAREITTPLVGGTLPLSATAAVAAAGGHWWPVALIMTAFALVTAVSLPLASSLRRGTT